MEYKRQKQSRKHSDLSEKKLGFTLVEVLMAMGILSFAALVIYSTWRGNFHRYKSSKVKVTAVELLQKKILELETEYKNKVFSLPTELQEGSFEEDDEYKGYFWEWQTQKFLLPDLSSIVSGYKDDSMISSVLNKFTQYLNQSIREVIVTVKYKTGDRVQYKYSVPFFIVDFNRKLQLPFSGMAKPSSNTPQGENR